jgi:hypothetical protein
MRVVIANHSFAGVGGTESYMLSVAEQLTRTGHEVFIYAPQLGPMADIARDRGTRTIGGGGLPEHCELVLAQDATSCLELWQRYPDAVRVFVAHSALHALQYPPQIPGAYQALVVLNERMERWAAGLAWHPRLVRLRQPVDLERFRLPPVRRSAPPRVLVVSNYPFGTRTQTLTVACSSIGAELRWLGVAHGVTTPNPEDEIAGAEIVIGLGRSVLDGMAGARAAFVLGPLGGDGWVTEATYPELERDGFTGRATSRSFDLEALTAELSSWTPQLGSVARELASRHHDVTGHARELIVLARELGAPATPPTGAEPELARLVRVEWQRSEVVYATRRQNARLQQALEQHERAVSELELELARARTQTADTQAAFGALERRLTTILATRRYRFAGAAARPLEALRSLVRSLLGVVPRRRPAPAKPAEP